MFTVAVFRSTGTTQKMDRKGKRKRKKKKPLYTRLTGIGKPLQKQEQKMNPGSGKLQKTKAESSNPKTRKQKEEMALQMGNWTDESATKRNTLRKREKTIAEEN